MGLGEKGWLVLGTHFRCLGVPADLQPPLAALLQGFPQPDPASPLDEPPEVIELRAEPQDAAPRLEYRLINEAIARARHHWVLHAGAVEGPRGTCLIVGESGAGKTSLTLWLWASGLRLVTDDLCPIRHGSLAPERFARALHMDCEYSPHLLARIPPRPPSYPVDYYPFPDASGGSPAPVTDLLVLRRGEGGLAPLSQAEAAHHLLGAVIKASGFDYGRALADMIRLSSQCRAHLLRAATPEGAGAAALALLAP